MRKIDFHIHTKPDVLKDNKFEFSIDWLKEYVKRSELNAIAITNHNLFDIDQFDEIIRDMQDICTVFPGMELSLENFHVQVIYNNDDLHKWELSKASQRLKELKLGDRGGISISTFKSIFKSWKDSILVFEYGKSNNVKHIPSELSEALCLMGVSNPRKFNKVYHEDDITPVLFSDAHATENNSDPTRDDIKKLMLKQTFLECDDSQYSDIYNALKNKSSVGINSDILKDSFSIGVYNEKREIETKVKVSTGLNLIIGSRGSGKTYFLENVKNSVKESELFEIKQFQSSKKAETILNDRKKAEINTNFKKWKEKYAKEWDYIYNNVIKDDQILTEHDFVEKLNSYLEDLKRYYKSENRKSSANKINLFRENELSANKLIDTLDDQLEAIDKLVKAKEPWNYMKNRIDNQILNIDTLRDDINQFKQLLEKELEKDRLDEKIKEIVNRIIRSAQEVIIRQTGVPNSPKINMIDLYRNYYFMKKANAFLKDVIREQKLSAINIGGYKIKVRITPYSSVSEFKKSHSVRSFANQFNRFYKTKDYIQFLKEYKDSVGIGSIQRDTLEKIFVNVEADLLTADDVPASGGQKIGFSLMLALDNAKDSQYVIVDEPEASLDNKFIKNNLISKLREVSKKSTVFVVTHNSTLGTLLNPNYLIVAKRKGKSYSYLSGDFKQNKISNETKEISSDEDFINAMEAGIDTYKEKGIIYIDMHPKFWTNESKI